MFSDYIPDPAVELLQKLLKGEFKTRRRKNVVLARSFAEMLEQSLRRNQNRAIEAAQVIEEPDRVAGMDWENSYMIHRTLATQSWIISC